MRSYLRPLIAGTLGLLIFASPVFACIWPPGEHHRIGKPIDLSQFYPSSYFGTLVNGHQKRPYWQQVLEELEPLAKRRSDRSIDNRIAVAMIHLGRVEEAISILERLERSKPGSYEIASNLGTAYELVGDNERAIEWITEGMRRDPESHFGTEWLHVKILRAKQAIKLDPTWAGHSSVLEIDWETVGNAPSRIAVADENGKVHDASSVQKAIEYQLYERTEFVKPPDPTVASLLHDLSHLLRLTRSEEHGNMVYGGARLYGYDKIDSRDLPPTPLDLSFIGLVAMIAVLTIAAGVGFWLSRRRV